MFAEGLSRLPAMAPPQEPVLGTWPGSWSVIPIIHSPAIIGQSLGSLVAHQVTRFLGCARTFPIFRSEFFARERGSNLRRLPTLRSRSKLLARRGHATNAVFALSTISAGCRYRRAL